MRYTLWLDGHLLGETRMEHRGPGPGQRLGGLEPTPYGLEVLPRLCGFLEAASAMKLTLLERGVSDPDTDVDRTMQFLETTPQGTRFSLLVKQLSQLELRESGGETAHFHTIVITDLKELGALSRTFDAEHELAQGTPRYIISATQVSFRSVSAALRGANMRIRIDPN